MFRLNGFPTIEVLNLCSCHPLIRILKSEFNVRITIIYIHNIARYFLQLIQVNIIESH